MKFDRKFDMYADEYEDYIDDRKDEWESICKTSVLDRYKDILMARV